MNNKLITALMVVLLLAPFLFGGCAKNTGGEGFAIYLTKDGIPVSQMEVLSHVEIDDAPLISGEDIVSYDWETHDILLTPEAFQRLDSMQIPTNGVSFLVCVDGSPLYWGAFWALYSSQSFGGITIMLKPSLAGENTIRISRGYPSESFYQGEDSRSNPLIKEALEKAGKLK
jgi:hypothetical protein